MTPHVETNLSHSPRKRFSRAWASCLLGLLLALGGSALFPARAHAQQRWDYWGRSVAVKYRADLSRDDALCKAVVAALNERKVSGRLVLSYGVGLYSNLHRLHVRIPSLYQNPMFVTWMPQALSQPNPHLGFPEPVEWGAIPLYNDGQDVAVVRVTSVSTHFALQSLVAFDDVESFKARKWEYRNQLLTDEAGLRLLQKPGTTRYDQSHYIPPPAIPLELRSKPRWKLFKFDGFGEFDLIRFAGKIYVFLREPPEEVALVSEVHRDRTANAICFIGPTKYPFAKR